MVRLSVVKTTFLLFERKFGLKFPINEPYPFWNNPLKIPCELKKIGINSKLFMNFVIIFSFDFFFLLLTGIPAYLKILLPYARALMRQYYSSMSPAWRKKLGKKVNLPSALSVRFKFYVMYLAKGNEISIFNKCYIKGNP